eukprot:scaffold30223_cov32-Phaeocystis_antarctica.AAC.2
MMPPMNSVAPAFHEARAARRALGAQTGRDEARCHALLGYTDDVASVLMGAAATPDVQWVCKAIGHICARAPACPPRAQHALQLHARTCATSLALRLHSTHPLSIRFLAGLNVSFPTRCGGSCGMPVLLEHRKESV